MEILGVITARGGSRRVPRKNARLLCGKPLIVYTIEAAQRSKLLTRLILSSDDDEIIQIARDYGVEVPFVRPAYLATQTALSVEVLIHAAKFLENKEGYKPDIVTILEPTSPLRTAEDIDNTLRLHGTGNDSAVCIMGGIYSVRRSVLYEEGLYGKYVAHYDLPPERSIDINTHHDFELATLLMRRNAVSSDKLRNKR